MYNYYTELIFTPKEFNRIKKINHIIHTKPTIVHFNIIIIHFFNLIKECKFPMVA